MRLLELCFRDHRTNVVGSPERRPLGSGHSAIICNNDRSRRGIITRRRLNARSPGRRCTESLQKYVVALELPKIQLSGFLQQALWFDGAIGASGVAVTPVVTGWGRRSFSFFRDRSTYFHRWSCLNTHTLECAGKNFFQNCRIIIDNWQQL